MFIQRTNPEGDSCSGRVACTPAAAVTISGVDTAPGINDNRQFDPSPLQKPGIHRYIGVCMAVGFLLIAFSLWFYFSKWSKRTRRYYCCGGVREKKPALQTPEEEEKGEKSLEAADVDRDRGRRSERRRHSEKDIVKEVSGGVVVFAEVPKALPRRERHRELEHVQGIRFEPIRYDSRNGRHRS